jgi:hypothetical protein
VLPPESHAVRGEARDPLFSACRWIEKSVDRKRRPLGALIDRLSQTYCKGQVKRVGRRDG